MLGNIVDAEMRNGSADLKLGYTAATVSGTADSQNLTVSNITGGAFTADGIETLTVTTELVASTLTSATGSALKTLNIAGNKDLTISTALANTVTTRRLGSYRGPDDWCVAAGGNATVTGGSGDDTIDMAGGLTVKDTIDGGAGADTLKISVADDGGASTPDQAFTSFPISNVETVSVAINDATGTTINAAGLKTRPRFP